MRRAPFLATDERGFVDQISSDQIFKSVLSVANSAKTAVAAD